jgi:integrase
VAAFGGLRWGELAGLRRKRVDLERGTVTVAEQLLEVNGIFSVGPPKSAAGRRTVSLPAVVVEALAEHLARYTAKSPEAYVFLSSQGRHLRRSNFNRWVWQPATRAAGVEGLRVHDLRHTAGTLATAAGGSLREVMDRLGHSTTVAAVRYQHVMARPGRRHCPGAEPADRGQVSAAMARRWHASPKAHRWAWNRPGVGPGLSCWFVVEPPAGIEPATPSLP